MQVPQVYCNIDEKAFSVTIFLTRLLAGGTLLYVSAGCLLYYREFLFNAAAISCPLPVALGVVIAELVLAFLLILGWFTRVAAGLSVLCTAGMGVVFFASNFNKVYVALLILLTAALLPAALLGPGRISLDFTHARRRVEKQFRG
ncbi:MAG: hypothetical protein IJ876_02785 [Elusimicrobiaceae bacterium]|nr:hypothetical protein [Elusimicrobiaceae bacterium]